MKVNITSKGFTANDRQVEFIEKKFRKLDKFFSDDVVVNVTMGYRGKRQLLEAMINTKGTMFRAECEDSDMNTCVEKAVDKMKTQITRNRKKLQKLQRHNNQLKFEAFEEAAAGVAPVEEPVDSLPVKTKTFDVTSMSVEEAIMQMELLDHSFFVFLNAETAKISVVYKRNDGKYGLLNPNY